MNLIWKHKIIEYSRFLRYVKNTASKYSICEKKKSFEGQTDRNIADAILSTLHQYNIMDLNNIRGHGAAAMSGI